MFYWLISGTLGFTLVVTGLSLMVRPGVQRVRIFQACINLSVGLVYCLGSLERVVAVPIDVDYALNFNLYFLASQAMYGMVLYVFGGQKRSGQFMRVLWIGFAWTQFLWMACLLDWLLGLGTVATGLNDGLAMGPVHRVVSHLSTLWPVLACVLSIRHSRWHLSDMPKSGKESRILVLTVYFVALVVAFNLAAKLAGSLVAYQVGNLLFEALVVAFWLVTIRRPRIMARVRQEVRTGYQQRLHLDQVEAAIIGDRLARLVDDGVFRRADLNLTGLSRLVKVPAYRMSRYFNEQLASTFSSWLNGLRIGWVCARMEAQPDQPLLELAFAAGYRSKTTFNTQFARFKQMSPSEFRREHALNRD